MEDDDMLPDALPGPSHSSSSPGHYGDEGELSETTLGHGVVPDAPPLPPAGTATHATYEQLDDIFLPRTLEVLQSCGGRPSFPLHRAHEGIWTYPGEYRDILSYWSDYPDEMPMEIIFRNQLGHWQHFLEYQRLVRGNESFTDYVATMRARLLRAELNIPGVFTGNEVDARRDFSLQDKFNTWLAYFDWVYMDRETIEGIISRNKHIWSREWDHLLRKGVLSPSEMRPNYAIALCDRSSSEIAREKVQQLEALSSYSQASAVISRRRRGGVRDKDREDMEDRAAAVAKEVVDEQNRRMAMIDRFVRSTKNVRSNMAKAQRQDLLLHWIAEQLTLVAIEEGRLADTQENRAAARPSFRHHQPVLPESAHNVNEADIEAKQHLATSSEPPSQEHGLAHKQPGLRAEQRSRGFMQLPPEIRRQIWIEALPPQPTVHFFDMVNHPRPHHLRHHWSIKEYRIQPTRLYDSGYKRVYPLVSTCTEAREVIWRFYMSLHTDVTIKTVFSDTHINFDNMDWIPRGDLIVICIPPVFGQLSERDAVTFDLGDGFRPVGLRLPKEITATTQLDVSETFTSSIRAVDCFQLDNLTLEGSFLETLHRYSGRYRESERREINGFSVNDADRGFIRTPTALYLIPEGWEARSVGLESGRCLRSQLLERRVGALSWHSNLPAWVEKEQLTHWHETDLNQYVISFPRDYEDESPPFMVEKPERELWWLGSGDKALVSSQAQSDLVDELRPVKHLPSIFNIHDLGETKNASILGWVE